VRREQRLHVARTDQIEDGKELGLPVHCGEHLEDAERAAEEASHVVHLDHGAADALDQLARLVDVKVAEALPQADQVEPDGNPVCSLVGTSDVGTFESFFKV
jgi:hypothetical protein